MQAGQMIRAFDKQKHTKRKCSSESILSTTVVAPDNLQDQRYMRQTELPNQWRPNPESPNVEYHADTYISTWQMQIHYQALPEENPQIT